MDINLYFNTEISGYFVCDNNKLNTKRLFSTSTSNFPLVFTYYPINNAKEVAPPLTFEVTYKDKLQCDSPYIKLLKWSGRTYEIFVCYNASMLYVLPRPIKQVSVVVGSLPTLATLSCDTKTRLFIEGANDCQLLTLGDLINPTLSAIKQNNIDYLIVTDDASYLCVVALGSPNNIIINQQFSSVVLNANITTVTRLKDIAQHIVTTTYEFNDSGLNVLREKVERANVVTDIQLLPIAFFQAVKLEYIEEVKEYLSGDFAELKVEDLIAFFGEYDEVKVPTLISAPNTVALIDRQIMTVKLVKVELKEGKISNFNLVENQ